MKYMKQTQPPEMLTVKDMAKTFRVSLGVIYDMIKEDKIKAVRLGKVFRIPSSERERLMTPTAPK